jgi:hypothetical protein
MLVGRATLRHQPTTPWDRVCGAVLIAVALVGCSAKAAAPTTTVALDFTPVTAATTRPTTTTSPTTVAPTTTVATGANGQPWPEGAPVVNFYEQDEIERTRQFRDFLTWQGQDSRRQLASYKLYVEPGSVAETEQGQAAPLNAERNVISECSGVFDSYTRWRRESTRTIWIQVVGSGPACSGTANGVPVTRPAIPLIVYYFLWSQQSNGSWLIADINIESEILAP